MTLASALPMHLSLNPGTMPAFNCIKCNSLKWEGIWHSDPVSEICTDV